MIKAIPLAIATLFLTGCAATQQAEKKYEDDQQVSVKAFQGAYGKTSAAADADATTPSNSNFIRSTRNWVNPIPLVSKANEVKLPEIFSRRVSITMPGTINATEVLSELQRASGIRINISQDVYNTEGGQAVLIGGTSSTNVQPKVTPLLISDFVFNGTLKDAFDLLAVKANVSWRWTGSQINVFRFETKTYNISALAGTTNVNSTVALTGGTAGTSASGGESGGGSETTNAGSSTSGISRQANLTVWDEVRNFLIAQLSPEGKIAVLETNGVVTITDIPVVHERIQKTIDELNALMTQQVFLNVDIYSLTQTASDNVGVDWNLVWGGSQANFGFTSAGNTAGGSSLFSTGVLTGPFAGTNVILNALSRLGRVSLLDQYSVTTLNGQPAPIAANRRIGYLAEVEVTPGADGEPPTASLKPGEISAGINMNVIPKVEPNGQIILEYVMNMNDVLEIRSFSSNGSTIELPTSDLKTISNRAVLRNGQTLVLSGFKKQRTNLNQAGVGSPNNLLLGGRNNSSIENQYLIITVTPYVAQNRSRVRR